MSSLLRASVIAAGCVAVLGACAPGGKVRAPDVRLPQSFELHAQTDLAAAAPDKWWTAFGDDQLNSLIDEALVRAPDARTAMARLDQAMAVRSAALTSYNPQGALTGQGSDQHTETKYSGINLGGSSGGLASLFLPANETKAYSGAFNVSWEVDLFGRRKAARRSANADLLAARFDFEASRLSLTANVATSLFQARALAVQLEDARANARITDDLALLGKRKLGHGLIAGSDAARLDADAATANSELERIRTLAIAARRTLLVLIGRGTDPVESLTVKAELYAPPKVPGASPSDILRRRPDVREAEQRVRSAVGAVDLQKLALWPSFTLQPGGSLSHSEANFISKTSVWTIAAGASMPVLDRPRLLAMVRLQRARAEEAVTAYELAVQGAYRDAENGLNTMIADRTRLDLLTEAEARSSYAFKANQKAYDLGLVDLNTLLSSERSWRAARSALTGLQAGALTDAVTTIKALGGSWSGASAPVKG
jgi:NodT family efflux transporter outer membrane factor (OMF) lipoprotein